jgi:hypothetical protein
MGVKEAMKSDVGNDLAFGGQKVSLSRDVHFVEKDGTHRAAKVTEVLGRDNVHLVVFHPYLGPLSKYYVTYSESEQPETWHWPERV